MKQLFSTADVRPHERFDAWHAAARQFVIDHDSHAESRREFSASLAGSSIDDLTIVSHCTSPMTFERSSAHVTRSAPDELMVCRQVEGEMTIEQAGQVATLRPGDFMLLDPRLPYRGMTAPGASVLVVKFPSHRLDVRIGSSARLLGHAISPNPGENAMASDLLVSMAGNADHLGEIAANIADHALDLVAISFATTQGLTTHRVSSAKFAVLTRIRALIEHRLADPGLNPLSIAKAAGVSVRYANSVLSSEKTSLRQLIVVRRLERCRQALAHPAQRHRSISEIAYKWGFSDMTHFARRFRAAYGCLPRDYRHRIQLESSTA